MRRSGYSALRWLLLMAVGTIGHSAVAQPLQQSHRILELPQSGMSDLQQQLQKLRQLQSLVGDQKNQTPESPGIDSEQLQQMIKRFGGDLPQNILPMLNNIPPNVIRDTLADPKARQQIQQMLQRYAKDHQLPRGTPDSNMPLLPPAEGNRPQSRSTGNPPSSSGREQGPPEQGRDISRSDEVLQKAWEGMMKKLKTANQPSSSRPPEPLPNERPADDESLQNSWSDVLVRLIEEDRKLRDGSNAAVSDDKRPRKYSFGKQAIKQDQRTDGCKFFVEDSRRVFEGIEEPATAACGSHTTHFTTNTTICERLEQHVGAAVISPG